VAELPSLATKLKKKLEKKDGSCTVAEIASLVMALAVSFVDAEPKQQVALLVVAKKLMDCLQAHIARSNLRPARTAKRHPWCAGCTSGRHPARSLSRVHNADPSPLKPLPIPRRS
jgi:hypothetical protein